MCPTRTVSRACWGGSGRWGPILGCCANIGRICGRLGARSSRTDRSRSPKSGPSFGQTGALRRSSKRSRTARGGLALNIKKLGQSDALDREKLLYLNAFVQDIYALQVNVPDLTVQNVVWDEVGRRFVLIDGLGDKTLLPLREWLPALNERQIDARFAKIGEVPGLDWDGESRCFRLPDGDGGDAMHGTCPTVSRGPTVILDLSDQTPIANGKVRDIYIRPGRPDWVLKVSRPHRRKAREARRGLLRNLKRRYGLGPYKAILREYQCYLLTARRAERLDLSIPIAEIGGVLRTDQGLASVMRRLTAPDGSLAPKFSTVVYEGQLDDRAVAALNDFVETVRALNLLLSDLHGGNLVYAADENRFILIDGFGKGGALRPRKFIRAINLRHIERERARLKVGDAVRWNATVSRYERVVALQ